MSNCFGNDDDIFESHYTVYPMLMASNDAACEYYQSINISTISYIETNTHFD